MRCLRLWIKAFRVFKQSMGPTSRHFVILMRLGRPQKPSRRPNSRPTPDKVEAGGNSGGQKNKTSTTRLRAEERVSKRAEDSEFVRFVEPHVSEHHTFMYTMASPAGWGSAGRWLAYCPNHYKCGERRGSDKMPIVEFNNKLINSSMLLVCSA